MPNTIELLQGVNPLTAEGENPEEIGKKITAETQKQEHTRRKRTGQTERLDNCIQSAQTHVQSLDPSRKNDVQKIINILQGQRELPPSKPRLKIIYKCEEKLNAWASTTDLPNKEEPPQKNYQNPRSIPKKSEREETLKMVEILQQQLNFLETNNIPFDLSNKCHVQLENICIQIKNNQKVDLKKIREEINILETRILKTSQKKPNSKIQTLSNWWFQFKMKLLILILLPEKQWPKAKQFLLEEQAKNHYPPEGIENLKKLSNSLEKL